MALTTEGVLARPSGSGVGTNAGVTVTVTGAAGQILAADAIQCSGDAAALITIESPSGTTVWRKRFAAAFAFSDSFPLGAVKGPTAQSMLVKISASTSNCEANIQCSSFAG